jgi:D-3-phosphoglycerate dehydrogenase / 2-oxoglutarate reductase
MHRILIADPLDAAGVEILRAAGAEVYEVTAADRTRLAELVADCDALVVRSMTKVTAELLRAGRRLKVVGRAGIGVDNVDIDAATQLGILVVNAPTANVLSATEHTFALMLALARKLPAADAAMKREVWDRKSFLGNELQGKTLGIIGFGRIGQRVALRARAFEMKLCAYDPFLDPVVARRLDALPLALDELLAQSDVVTLHTPFTAETRGMLDRRRLGLLRAGALLVNCGRGGLVDEEALLEALDAGRLAGAALDVFAEEPPTDWRLARHPRVVATPHIGAQTVEAQERISTETARMVLAALAGSLEITAVNLPFGAAGLHGEPFLRLGEQLGNLASALHGAVVSRVQVDFCGIAEELHRPLRVAVLKGVLTPFLGEGVNYVNAEVVASGRSIELVSAVHQQPRDYAVELGVTITGEGRTVTLAGTLFGEHDSRVVSFDGYRLEFRPTGRLLVLRNSDVPGVVGKVGTLLGAAGVNIAEIHLARRDGGTDAMAVLRLDQDVPAPVLARLRALAEIRSAQFVELHSQKGE